MWIEYWKKTYATSHKSFCLFILTKHLFVLCLYFLCSAQILKNKKFLLHIAVFLSLLRWASFAPNQMSGFCSDKTNIWTSVFDSIWWAWAKIVVIVHKFDATPFKQRYSTTFWSISQLVFSLYEKTSKSSVHPFALKTGGS